MRKLNFILVFCFILAVSISCFFARPVLAIPGDFNGDGSVSAADLVYLNLYLYYGGNPPPNPMDADVDGTAGINFGDILQLSGYLFQGCSLKPYTGIGPNISNITFTFPRIEPGSLGVPFNLDLKLTDNPGPDLNCIVLTFSYQNLLGNVEVDLNSITSGSIVPPGWTIIVEIDNVNKRALFNLVSGGGSTIAAGTTGQIAILNFTRTANPTGPATCMSPVVFPPTNSPLLIGSSCANGTTPLNRVLIPKIGKKGDINSDGIVSISDIVFLNNYLFRGGPAPCGW